MFLNIYWLTRHYFVPPMVVPTVMAMHSVAAAVAATMAAVNSAATTTVLGAGRSRSKHGKAERSARGDGQKGRFTNHDTLL